MTKAPDDDGRTLVLGGAPDNGPRTLRQRLRGPRSKRMARAGGVAGMVAWVLVATGAGALAWMGRDTLMPGSDPGTPIWVSPPTTAASGATTSTPTSSTSVSTPDTSTPSTSAPGTATSTSIDDHGGDRSGPSNGTGGSAPASTPTSVDDHGGDDSTSTTIDDHGDDTSTSTTIDDHGGNSGPGGGDTSTSTTIDDHGGDTTTPTTIDDHGGDRGSDSSGRGSDDGVSTDNSGRGSSSSGSGRDGDDD